jgi:hypothetical protein
MNLIELNLYLSSRKQIESDYYLDSFINNIETEKKKKESAGMKRKYRLGLGRSK